MKILCIDGQTSRLKDTEIESLEAIKTERQQTMK